jgi:hypothetical protein
VTPPSPRSARRIAAAALAAALALPLATVPAVAGGDPSGYTSDCPLPESLVSGTAWTTRHLARGLTLREGQHKDSTGYVHMHLLTADVTDTHLAFRPLVRKLAMRSPLSALAAGRTGLLAATNTGFFDFRLGTPLGPVVDKHQPVMLSSHRMGAVGFGTDGRLQAGDVSLAATVTADGGTRRLAGFNTPRPRRDGLTAYTARWGSEPVRMPPDAAARYVKSGAVASATGRYSATPTTGFLLVARGSASTQWLQSLPRGTSVTLKRKVMTDAPRAFRLAYGVGAQIVQPGGVARTDLTCRKRYPQPARTAIGWSHHGKQLLLLVVEDKPGTDMHGLDSNQTGRVMADLGAKEAYLFDGSGSSEMLARLRSHPDVMSLRTYPADGVERTMPLGFGIFHH